MNIWQLVLVGAAIFGGGMLLMWKRNKGDKMTPDEKAIYDTAYAEAKKDVIVQKAVLDAQKQVKSGGVGGALQNFAEQFGNFQEEGRKMGLPSILDYDKEDKKRGVG